MYVKGGLKTYMRKHVTFLTPNQDEDLYLIETIFHSPFVLRTFSTFGNKFWNSQHSYLLLSDIGQLLINCQKRYSFFYSGSFTFYIQRTPKIIISINKSLNYQTDLKNITCTYDIFHTSLFLLPRAPRSSPRTPG